jgi:dsDNA-specific endonuclease/ATPase MutS2
MLRSTEALSAKRYAEEIDNIEKKEQKGTSLRTDVRRLYADVLKYKRTMKGKLKRKFDHRANRLMRRVVKRLLQAETKAHNAQA